MAASERGSAKSEAFYFGPVCPGMMVRCRCGPDAGKEFRVVSLRASGTKHDGIEVENASLIVSLRAKDGSGIDFHDGSGANLLVFGAQYEPTGETPAAAEENLKSQFVEVLQTRQSRTVRLTCTHGKLLASLMEGDKRIEAMVIGPCPHCQLIADIEDSPLMKVFADGNPHVFEDGLSESSETSDPMCDRMRCYDLPNLKSRMHASGSGGRCNSPPIS